jgi:hypothetical protein
MNYKIAAYFIPQTVHELILFSKTVTSNRPNRHHFSHLCKVIVMSKVKKFLFRIGQALRAPGD